MRGKNERKIGKKLGEKGKNQVKTGGKQKRETKESLRRKYHLTAALVAGSLEHVVINQGGQTTGKKERKIDKQINR